MSKPESVLARWSRLKRQSTSSKRADAESSAADAAASPAQEGNATSTKAPAFDVESLPPIESIVAGSDIRPFLQLGVPVELTRAALRRAWSSDPAIRDFIEIAENQWNFAKPETIPGFGALGANDDVRCLVAQALQQRKLFSEGQARDGAPMPPPRVEVGASAPRSVAVRDESYADSGNVRSSDVASALQHKDATTANTHEPAPARRRHGGALPT
jgi:hypothetical protein